MTSRATAAFLAGAASPSTSPRPGTPNDQAWIESFFGHLKAENPHLQRITGPGELEAELGRQQRPYNTVRRHEGIGYLTPKTSTPAAAQPSAPPAKLAWKPPTKPELPSAGNCAKIPRSSGGWVFPPPSGAFFRRTSVSGVLFGRTWIES